MKKRRKKERTEIYIVVDKKEKWALRVFGAPLNVED